MRCQASDSSPNILTKLIAFDPHRSYVRIMWCLCCRCLVQSRAKIRDEKRVLRAAGNLPADTSKTFSSTSKRPPLTMHTRLSYHLTNQLSFITSTANKFYTFYELPIYLRCDAFPQRYFVTHVSLAFI